MNANLSVAIAMQCATLWTVALLLGDMGARVDYQKPCTDIRSGFQYLVAQADVIEKRSTGLTEAEIIKTKKLLQSATANQQCLFDSLSDTDAFALVQAICRLAAYLGDGRNSEERLLWGLFLQWYPGSAHLDEALWLRAKAVATPYEYEGYADAALSQIELLQAFIKDYPANSYVPDAKLELARVCRVAYETFRYGEGLSTAPNLNQQIGRSYRERAKLLLGDLCNQSPARVRQGACAALKELEAGRCVYIGPGSPNPNFQDHWTVRKSK
jgi:hypothetical protein